MQTEIDTVLKAISIKYNIDYSELKLQFIKPKQLNEDITSKKTQPQKRGRKKKEKEEFIETEEYEWEGFTEEEFVYFCSFVDHDILDQIENTLRDKNELR